MADDSSNGIMWFIAGLGLGALVGVLYAPQSGEETREQIRRSARDGADRVREQARQAREQANEYVDRGREKWSQQRDNFRNAVDAGRQAYREATTPTSPASTEGSNI
jgi:gas vesicle protein